MNNNKNSKNFWSRVFGGGGFYIALLLCIVAVGIGVWAVAGGLKPASIMLAEDMPAAASQTEAGAFNPKTPAASAAASAKSAIAKPDVAPVVYVWPLSGKIELEYSVNALIYNPTLADWRTHGGIDISADAGAEVAAVSGGTVESIDAGGPMGTTVTLYHGGGVRSTYSNLQETILVSAGDTLTIGDPIGYVGSTSITEGSRAHLHLEMSVDNVKADPQEFLP